MVASRSAASLRCLVRRASIASFSRLCCTDTLVRWCAELIISRISAWRTTQSASFALTSTPMLRGLEARGLMPFFEYAGYADIGRPLSAGWPPTEGRADIGRVLPVRRPRGETAIWPRGENCCGRS